MTDAVMEMRARAREVARMLEGSGSALESYASEAEINSPDFCAELDDHVRSCETCGYWAETVDGEGNCDECAGIDIYGRG